MTCFAHHCKCYRKKTKLGHPESQLARASMDHPVSMCVCVCDEADASGPPASRLRTCMLHDALWWHIYSYMFDDDDDDGDDDNDDGDVPIQGIVAPVAHITISITSCCKSAMYYSNAYFDYDQTVDHLDKAAGCRSSASGAGWLLGFGEDLRSRVVERCVCLNPIGVVAPVPHTPIDHQLPALYTR